MKEQYFIYDGNALIADIGGYLGLLLGLSIFGIFNTFRESSAGAKKVVQKWFSSGNQPKPRGLKIQEIGLPGYEAEMWKSNYNTYQNKYY